MADFPPAKGIKVGAVWLSTGRIPLIYRCLLTSLSVGMIWLAFPGIEGEGVSWLVWVGLVPWGLALVGVGPRTGFLFGFLWGFVAFFGITPGIAIGVEQLLRISPLKIWLLYAISCSICALPYALFGYLQGVYGWLGKPWGAPRAAAGLSLLLIIASQFLPGTYVHALYNSPLMIQVLDLGGLPLLLFVVTLANWYIVDMILGLAQGQIRVIPAAAFVLLIAATAAYGKIRLEEFHEKAAVAKPQQRIQIVSIQPNIPSPFKGKSKERLRAVLRLSEQAAKKYPEGKLLVWPENPLNIPCNNEIFNKDLTDLAKKTSKSFLFPCARRLGKSPSYLFSAVQLMQPENRTHLVQPKGESEFQPPAGVNEEYHKIILFPFGEYLPLSRELPFLRRFFKLYRNFTPGTSYRVMRLRDMGFMPLANIGLIPSICYESVFSRHIRRFVSNGGNVIVNMTNDAWWGTSDLTVIHLALSAFRTVEYRVPLVRVTNSGVGAFVEATGEIVPGSLTPLFEEAVTSFPLFIPQDRSPYFRLGDWFLWTLLLWFFIEIGVRWIRKKENPGQ